jgi:hypothetical protein
MIEQMHSETWRPKGYSRKHNRGSAPCRRCGDGNHSKCRPRLDNMLCSCSCPIAEGVRQEADGMPSHWTEQQKVKEMDRLSRAGTSIIPLCRQRWEIDVMIPRLNRQDISPLAIDRCG